MPPQPTERNEPPGASAPLTGILNKTIAGRRAANLGTAELEVDRIRLTELLSSFLELHAGRPKQRTPEWYALKSTTIGGSELAALLGKSRYATFGDVVKKKAGIGPEFKGNSACRWGTLFERAIEVFVETDCGVSLGGTDVNVPAPKGSGLEDKHANSPDGYAVAKFYIDEEGVPRLCTTDREAREAAKERPQFCAIILLEFKCPFRRRPKGWVPENYETQIWSGLALSPPAAFGLFVDAVFRKCALWSLGPWKGYDRGYHVERTNPLWGKPVAWGLFAVYAPRPDATHAPQKDKALAQELYRAYFGIPFDHPTNRDERLEPGVIDFGECPKAIFEKALEAIDGGAFTAVLAGPAFADGRGSACLSTGKEIGKTVDVLERNPLPYKFLLGVIPWKCLQAEYTFAPRRLGYLEEVAGPVETCLAAAKAIREASDPVKAYAEYESALGRKKKASLPREEEIGAAQLQDLFDAIG